MKQSKYVERAMRDRLLALTRVEGIESTESAEDTKGHHRSSASEHYQTMQDICRNPELWKRWKQLLHLEMTPYENDLEDEPLSEESLSWARQCISRKKEKKQKSQKATIHSLWEGLLERLRDRWEYELSAIQTSILALSFPDSQVRAKGTKRPIAIFSDTSVSFGKGHSSFALECDRIYGFTTYLPHKGYISVLQAEQGDGDVAFDLIYPVHSSQLQPMGPGPVHMFRTQFEEPGQTHFLLLFSEIPFELVSPQHWSKEMSGWSWDQNAKDLFVQYLLKCSDSLQPFLLKVNVQEQESSP